MSSGPAVCVSPHCNALLHICHHWDAGEIQWALKETHKCYPSYNLSIWDLISTASTIISLNVYSFNIIDYWSWAHWMTTVFCKKHRLFCMGRWCFSIWKLHRLYEKEAIVPVFRLDLIFKFDCSFKDVQAISQIVLEMMASAI